MSTEYEERYAIKSVMKRYARNTELDEFLEDELKDAGYGGSEIQRTPIGTRISVYVTRPGVVIGRRGMGIRALTEKLEQKFGLANSQISVLEVEVPEMNPRIMCGRIVHSVSRGVRFRRAALWALNSIMGAGALGAEITIAGKLRSERSRFEKHRAGIVPKSGDLAKKTVRIATRDVLLKMGLYGIKVRIALKGAVPPEVEVLESSVEETVETEGEVSAKT